MGVGAYTAVVLGGESSENLWGLGLPMWIWLPGAAVEAALVGIIVSPCAVRLRGLYLGIVTVGLVFIGIHLSRCSRDLRWRRGRTPVPPLEFKLWKEEEPIIDFSTDGHWLWFDISGNAKTYLFCSCCW